MLSWDKYRCCLDFDFTTLDSMTEIDDAEVLFGFWPLLECGGSAMSAMSSGIDPKVCLIIGGGIVLVWDKIFGGGTELSLIIGLIDW